MAGEAGLVAVIWGGAGGTVSTVKARETTLSFPAASIALRKNV